MATAWVRVINDGSGTPNVVRKSHASTTVVQQQPGVYLVTFPNNVRGLTCVATLNNSVGTITAVPGDSAGLQSNQVTVSTLTLQNQFGGGFHFSLAVFFSTGRFDDIVGGTGGVLTTRARRARRGRPKASRAAARRRRRPADR
jgi:hypothetical protein